MLFRNLGIGAGLVLLASVAGVAGLPYAPMTFGSGGAVCGERSRHR